MPFRSPSVVAAVACAAALFAVRPAAAQDAAPYRKVTTISVPGDAGWDYLIPDAAAHRLYIAHGTKVDVVDIEKNAFVGTVDSVPGAHGATAAHGKIFATAGRTDEIVVADAATLKVEQRIKATGGNPDAVYFDAPSDRVITFNGRGKNATLLDAKTAAIVGTLDLGGKPEFAAGDGHGHVFVNVEDTGELVEFDAKAVKVLRRLKLEGCEEPSGLAFDGKRQRVFSVCGNKVMTVVDAKAFTLLQTVPTGAGTDGAAADAATGRAFASNGGDATITVVAPTGSTYGVLAQIPTGRGARTMAIDPATHRLYTATAEFGPTPAPTTEQPRPRPTIKPGTFAVHVFEPAR